MAVAAISEVADAAAHYGLSVSLYPHFGNLVERVADAVRIAEKTGRKNVGVTFNLCHWLRTDGPDIAGARSETRDAAADAGDHQRRRPQRERLGTVDPASRSGRLQYPRAARRVAAAWLSRARSGFKATMSPTDSILNRARICGDPWPRGGTMPNHLDELYNQRLNRYVTAMRNGQPDRVPIRPLAAEIAAQIRGLHLPGGHARLPEGLRSRDPLLPGFRLGRGRAQHGLRLDRPDPSRGAALLRRARHRCRSGCRVSISRAATRRARS